MNIMGKVLARSLCYLMITTKLDKIAEIKTALPESDKIDKALSILNRSLCVDET